MKQSQPAIKDRMEDLKLEFGIVVMIRVVSDESRQLE